jgi:cellulose biosynthesis protein BcsQ
LSAPLGTIITFYSYKGGTGRSMALANVAWILASAGKRVLTIDWDLEAPGLHRYFRPFLIDKELTSSEGVIDFVTNFADEVVTPTQQEMTADWYKPHADITRYALSVNYSFPGSGKIDFVPAGRQGATYATSVNSFQWLRFYEQLGGGALLEAAKEHVREKYDYILIDSRTGVSDTAGICTVKMPDSLVICFTYNNQSIEGASAVARSIIKSRESSFDQASSGQDSPSFRVFPVPMRVEQSELAKLRARQDYAWSVFDPFLSHISGDRQQYWTSVEVPYIAYFAYEEVLSTFVDLPGEKKIFASMAQLSSFLTHLEVSEFGLEVQREERDRTLKEFAWTPKGAAASNLSNAQNEPIQDLAQIADNKVSHLSHQQEEEVRRFFTRLVRVAKPDEGSFHTKIRVKVSEVSPLTPAVLALASSGVLIITESDGEGSIEIATETLLMDWQRLRDWLDEDVDFLLWRQRLRDTIQDWQASEGKSDFFLEGTALRTAEAWLKDRREDLNDLERQFIYESMALSTRSQESGTFSGFRAFIIRPFGSRSGIDFERVEKELIDPALTAVGIEGRTRGEIIKLGSIRVDMIQRLLMADLVLADLSIHNGNVFYELGIRHSLREKRTFMIRSEGDAYPFDLQTDRYFTYDRNDPAKSLPGLVKALKSTLASRDQDSPVFRSLPNMKPQDPAKFLAVPTGFSEEVKIAAKNRYLGDLELLAAEAKGFEWGVEGLRAVGRAQYSLKALRGARDTWEAVRAFNPMDMEANTLLGTLYQRLGDLTRSGLAVERVLERADVAGMDRAEALSLKARNAKTSWRARWADLDGEKRREAALRSPFLLESLTAYADAFDEALNHFYSGLNALGMLKVLIELATALPAIWAEAFDDDDEAEREIIRRREQFQMIAAAVRISINAVEERLRREAKSDIWIDISEADYLCLTSDRPRKVALAYRKALAGAPVFAAEAARAQLDLYQQLGVLSANVTEALKGFSASQAAQSKQERILFFTGHMIDKPGRQEPRFPAGKEDVARQAIRQAIEKERALAPIGYGIAGGASGGDILFHEVCAGLGIPTQLYLALPREEYIVASVRSAGPQWVERFNQLLDQHPETRVLSEREELPDWLVERADNYNIWQRNSLWLLHNALAEQEQSVTLIALWNGKTGDGPGGTADLVDQAGQRGSKVVILDTKELFGLE